MAVIYPAHPPASAAPPEAPTFYYFMYDLCVRSEVRLPIAAITPDPVAAPNVVVRCFQPSLPITFEGPVAARITCPIHGEHMRAYRREDGVWICFQGIGAFHVAPDAATVDVYPAEGADNQAIGLALAGPVLTFVRHRLGCPSLHASAVVTAQGAVAFVGPHGRGKSTMAASFMRNGAPLLTDDVLALVARDGRILGAPGPTLMKVWNETALHTLGLTSDLPTLTVNVEKRLFAPAGHFPYARHPTPLRALYVLDRYDPEASRRSDVTMRLLAGRDALLTLLAYASIRPYLVPAESALLVRTYAQALAQAPLHVLSYPDGFDHQEAVHQRIMEHLGAA